jgi:hypothetical protein
MKNEDDGDDDEGQADPAFYSWPPTAHIWKKNLNKIVYILQWR